MSLYYESHVTIDPVNDFHRAELQKKVEAYGFRVAKLLMQKGVPFDEDMFMTARSADEDDITVRTIGVVRALRAADYKVRRYKIELTVVDSKIKDTLELL